MDLQKVTAIFLLSSKVDPTLPQNKQVELYEMLLHLLERESKCVEQVRESEEEVREILHDRTQEEATSDLDISVYDTERNEKAKKHRRELVSVFTIQSNHTLPSSPVFLKPYENIVGKGENAGYQPFLLFQKFSTHLTHYQMTKF